MTTAITLPFAGGSFRFDLTDQEMTWLELGRRPGEPGPLRPMRLGDVFARILRGRYTVDGTEVGVPGRAEYSVLELNAIIRAALIGGGGGEIAGDAISWTEYDVDSYLARHLNPMPLAERWTLAAAVLGARIDGVTTPAPEPAA